MPLPRPLTSVDSKGLILRAILSRAYPHYYLRRHCLRHGFRIYDSGFIISYNREGSAVQDSSDTLSPSTGVRPAPATHYLHF